MRAGRVDPNRMNLNVLILKMKIIAKSGING
jgi:hypothetical protein